ncbi:hypothetical protein M0Q28_03500 [Patescibacteria group bacterium]|jgi:hypothetical protein|nr:hypothetical protein [Patescibacteria group bacterium]
MKPKKLAKKGPSSEELERLDREIQAALPRTNIGQNRRFSLTTEQHLDLFRLLRRCLVLEETKKNPKWRLVEDPVAKVIFDLLWKQNTGLAVMGAKQYSRYSRTGDSIQDAHLGLREGLLRFDPERGTRPSTYIMWWIRHAVMRNRRHSENGAIPLSSNALTQIKNGRVEKPKVLSYDAIAHHHGLDDIGNASFMRDQQSVSQDSAVESRRAFRIWKAKLREAAEHLERECQVEYLLFSLETGYGRYPKGPVRMKVLKRLTGLKERDLHRKVDKVVERIGRRCGFKGLAQARHFIDAMVEYSLHLGIPL